MHILADKSDTSINTMALHGHPARTRRRVASLVHVFLSGFLGIRFLVAARLEAEVPPEQALQLAVAASAGSGLPRGLCLRFRCQLGLLLARCLPGLEHVQSFLPLHALQLPGAGRRRAPLPFLGPQGLGHGPREGFSQQVRPQVSARAGVYPTAAAVTYAAAATATTVCAGCELLHHGPSRARVGAVADCTAEQRDLHFVHANFAHQFHVTDQRHVAQVVHGRNGLRLKGIPKLAEPGFLQKHSPVWPVRHFRLAHGPPAAALLQVAELVAGPNARVPPQPRNGARGVQLGNAVAWRSARGAAAAARAAAATQHGCTITAASSPPACVLGFLVCAAARLHVGKLNVAKVALARAHFPLVVHFAALGKGKDQA